MASTFILKRKFYAQSGGVAANNEGEIVDLFHEAEPAQESIDVNKLPTAERIKELKRRLGRDDKPKVYQNLKDDRLIDTNKELLNRRRNLNKNRTVNQNININRNTNINNPSKEKAAQLDAQASLAKLANQNANSNGVNTKLIEIQKTNPLKPVSINQ